MGPFVSENNGYRISVKTHFDFDQSNPLQFHYLFRYTITISNIASHPSQLVSRKWYIKDGKGEVKVVEGPGVVGQTPHFQANQSFEYSSYSPLPTMKGEMWGHFHMVEDSGKKFIIDTPIFRFEVPSEYIDDY